MLGGLSKDKLVLDTTALSDSDNVGAYIRASNGDLIDDVTIAGVKRLAVDTTLKDGAGTALTSTLVSGKQALDVNMVNSIQVDLNGIYNVSTNATPDNTGVILFNRAATPALSDQVFTPTGGLANANGVVAANVHAADVNSFGMVYNGTTWDRLTGTGGKLDVTFSNTTIAVTQGTSPWVVSGALTVTGNVADDAVDSGNPLKVGSRVEAGPLVSISTAGDRADMISDMYRRVYVNNGSNIAILQTQKNVDNTAASALPTTALGGRRTIMVQNLSNKEIYVGASGVTSANGFVLAARATISLDVGPDVSVFAKGSAASAQDLRILELA